MAYVGVSDYGNSAQTPGVSGPELPPDQNNLLPESVSAQAPAGGRNNPLQNHERFTGPDGREYVRDGSVAFLVSDAEAAGWDVNNIQPSKAVSYRELKNQLAGGGGGGFRGGGNWAQIAQAAGLGDAVKAGWTKNNPQLFALIQALGYGQRQLGANGTFVNQGINGWQVFDRSGNVIQSGTGTAPPELYDQVAQQRFQQQGAGAIQGVGGNLAQRLAGDTGRTPPYVDPSQNRGAPGAAEKIVNGVLYRQNPDGSWVKIGPAPAPGGPLPPTPQGGGTDPAQPMQAPPPTTRPVQFGKLGGGVPGPSAPPQMGFGQGSANQFKIPDVKPLSFGNPSGAEGVSSFGGLKVPKLQMG